MISKRLSGIEGVQLSAIVEFSEQVTDDAATTEHIVMNNIIPATLGQRCKYSILLAGRTGPATHFVCHAWSSRFRHLISSLQDHFLRLDTSLDSVFIWLGR